MTIIDEHGNPHKPAGTAAGGQFTDHTRTRPVEQLASPEPTPEPEWTSARDIRVDDIVVGDAWDDETDSEVVIEKRVFDVRATTRLHDMRTMIELIYDDGSTGHPVPASARLRVIPAPRDPNARDPKDLLDEMRALTRLVRTGKVSDQVVAAAIRVAEDPGRDRNTDAYSRYFAGMLEVEGGYADAVARLRAAADGR